MSVPGRAAHNGPMAQATRLDDPGMPLPWGAPAGRPALAVAVTIVGTVAAIAEITTHALPEGPIALLVVALAGMAVVPVGVARQRPAVAGWVTAGGSALLVAWGQPLPWAVAIAAGLTAFGVARAKPLRMTGALLAVYALVALTAPGPSRTAATSATAAAACAAAVVGATLRWRERSAQLTATVHDAERTLLAHVARGERARIARELHDVVAHHISMIAVQAEAARLLVPDLAPDGQRRLVEIGDTARAALTEMRRLLGVLREDSDTATPARTPQPGLPELDALVDDARALTGATTRLIVHGPVTRLDPGVELTAYRIVQEALTNARRHASGAAIDVELDYRPDALHVRVRDNGPGTNAGRARDGGHGLNGMRERTAMLGGRITAGPLAHGGFAITAVLPRVAEP